MTSAYASLEIDGKTIKLSNLEKPLFPDGFTKREVIEYYSKISPYMLPHLKGRPLTMKRYPEGVAQGFFYEKECPSYRPAWMKNAILPSRDREKKSVSYCVVNDLASLIWVANLASLEFHVLLSKAPKLNEPDYVVLDLDPGEGKALRDCAQVALQCRILLEKLGLQAFIKMSGGKGLHLYIPLNGNVTFEQTSSFAHAIALQMEKEDPQNIISVMNKESRKGKIFIDWSQNSNHKTTVAPYSIRAGEKPYVAAPLKWTEVLKLSREKSLGNFGWTAKEMISRTTKEGDLFRDLLKMKQTLPAAFMRKL